MNTKAAMQQSETAQSALPPLAASASASVLPEAFFDRARARANAVALRRKRLGLWEEISWREYEQAVRALAASLIEIGVKPGDRVGLIAENRVEWLVSDLGILAAGGVTCAMYTTSSAEQVAYVVRHAEARVVIAENEEQLDKLLPLCRSGELLRVIVMDRKGLRDFRDEAVLFWEEIARSGPPSSEQIALVDRAWRQRTADDVAILVYTSGTSGAPKGVMLSHGNILWACRSVTNIVKLSEGDEFLSFLPLCHVAERINTVFNQVVHGTVVSFVETLDTVRDNLGEVRPHIFFAVPRIWEKLYNTIELRLRDSPWSKRRAYAWAIELGRLMARARCGGTGARSDRTGTAPATLALQHAIADQTVLAPLRRKLGLDRVRYALSGAAPISPEVVSYFQAIGVPLVQGYGMTETAGVISLNDAGFRAPTTVGKPVPGVELRMAADGEILVRSPGVMLGYFKDEAATEQAISGGFLHTGDLGELDEQGRLTITDRKKDLIITAGGKNIAPQSIESRLRLSPYIHDAVVVGDRRKYVTVLIILDEDNVVAWAQRHRVQFGTYGELAQGEQVAKLVAQELEKINATLTHVEALKQFRVLDRPLSADAGELTPTLKVRRNVVEAKYKDLIESMYG
jgi:long-chain acyl-CoA synthetase